MKATAASASQPTPDLDPVPILRALDKPGVRYVIVGGYGATAHGVTLPELTTDIDFSPVRSAANLTAFVAALEELGATNLTKRPVLSGVISAARHNPTLSLDRGW